MAAVIGAAAPTGGATALRDNVFFAPTATRPLNPNGTLVVAYPVEPTNLDPRQTTDGYTRNVNLSLYDGLVVKTYHYGDRPLEIIPALATSWKVSKNKLIYTFQLRKGVRFHDGTAFNSAAVMFTFRSIIDPKFEYYCAPCNASSAADNRRIAGLRTHGPYSFSMTLKEPFGGWIDVLSSSTQFSIVSPTAVKRYGTDFRNHPVGTGYVKFVERVPGQRLVFERNPQYFRGQMAYKTLVIRPMADPVARANAVLANEVGVAEEISANYIGAWAGRSDVKVVTRTRPRKYTCHLNYRGNGPTTKIAFRQALSLAANRGAMNVLIYGKRASRANGWYSPGTAGYDATMPPFEFSLTKAKAALTRAGYPNGTSITLEVSTLAADDPKLLAVWQEDLRKIGINLKLVTVDFATWVGDWLKGLPPAPTGHDGMCLQSGQDTMWFLARFAGTYGWPENGGYNAGYYRNATAEALFRKASNSTTQTEYLTALRAANKAITQDFGMIMMVNDLKITGLRSNVQWAPARALNQTWYDAKVFR
jgi:peptide/nickel transport system substrate-binding protein